MNVAYRRGVHLSDLDFWLDPRDRKSVAFVSHAHSDHAGAHGRVLATAATAALMRHRLRRRAEYQPLEFRQPYALAELLGERARCRDCTLTLYPAGHVLGSAQALVETPSGRLLYSGDFKLRPGVAAEPIEIPRADVVVMETTFGRPGYVFPAAEEVIAAIREFCLATHAEGAVPVLLAYALGKGPELLAQLGSGDWELLLHPTLFEVVKRYEELGVMFPPHRLLDRGITGIERPPVVLCPPGPAYREVRLLLPRVRAACVSGWAIDRGAAYRMGVDACFPLSDHADYPELLEYVERTGARRILTMHGFDADFAQDLRLMGYDARPLADPVQPSLF
jgi:Cft2 family RNA processing exonuclease